MSNLTLAYDLYDIKRGDWVTTSVGFDARPLGAAELATTRQEQERLRKVSDIRGQWGLWVPFWYWEAADKPTRVHVVLSEDKP